MDACEWAYKTQVKWWPASSAKSDTDLLFSSGALKFKYPFKIIAGVALN
jgi:hypothetical protein